MGRVLVVATAGAGGDLQPLIAVALALRDRGHDLVVLGDRSVERSLVGMGVATEVLPPELDLGPALIGAIRKAMEATEGDLAAAGPLVQERMTAWAGSVAGPVERAVSTHGPNVVVTSLFGVEVLAEIDLACPWVVVNSTFYVGPDPPRPIEEDFGPRAVPLLSRYASLMGVPDLVLHATDRVFDLSFDGLPERHHYVGPLGIWESVAAPPSYLDEPGDPWVLASISSQMQDDLPIAREVLKALADRRVRVLVTVGPDHDPSELSTVPTNAHVEQVVPHSGVLERARLFIGHAGHGSVMKALWQGVPMVLVPWGRDQPGVAARASALGTAVVVSRDEASAEAIRLAADRVFDDEHMRDAAANHAGRLRSTDPPAVASELIEGIL
jgi:UDP:flavonoid glycosyltransferase YjiC (YdhE family)